MKISEVQIGLKINHPRHGSGMVIAKTKRTITAMFSNGVKAKCSYRYDDANFSATDF